MIVNTTGVLLTLGIAVHVHLDTREVSARRPIFQVVYYTWKFFIKASFEILKFIFRLYMIYARNYSRARQRAVRRAIYSGRLRFHRGRVVGVR